MCGLCKKYQKEHGSNILNIYIIGIFVIGQTFYHINGGMPIEILVLGKIKTDSLHFYLNNSSLKALIMCKPLEMKCVPQSVSSWFEINFCHNNLVILSAHQQDGKHEN